MKGIVQYCKKCFEDPSKKINDIKEICQWSDSYAKQHICVGYYTPDEKKDFCKYHQNEKLCDSVLTIDEYLILNEISVDYNFIQAMENLKQNDIIEFNLKLSQFKSQLEQEHQINQQQTNQVHCPKCGSINITTGQRGYSLLTGFIRSDKTVNRCANCGHKWQP